MKGLCGMIFALMALLIKASFWILITCIVVFGFIYGMWLLG